MSADLILTNGNIHTVDARQPTASAIAIRDGKILAVGSDEDMKSLMAAGSQWIDLGGRAVTPGLIDAHLHFQWYSLGLMQADLDGVPSLDEALAIVEAKAKELPQGQWIQGRGWQQDVWEGRRFPTARILDTVTRQGPAHLKHKSGHASWANSQALRIAGVTAETPDPPGGEIQRDQEGQPTGIFFETAIDLIQKHVPDETPDELADAMRQAQQNCWRYGLVGVHDFDGVDCFRAFQILQQAGDLGIRVVKNIPCALIDHAVALGLRSGYGNEWLRIGGTKIFADGALGPMTALMIDPYEGQPDNRGISVVDKEEMMEIASKSSANHLSVTVHAIGDRANHDVLDVYEAVRGEEAARGLTGRKLRHRIEHAQILHPDDIRRFAELDVIASMQPIHATSDMIMADSYWGERARTSYAWRALLETGATLVFGTDAPVERLDPLPNIYAAVNRRRPSGEYAPDGWFPEEKLTLEETIHGMTYAAAFTAGNEANSGSISPDKLADLTIFDRDIFAIDPLELDEIGIAGTVINGEFKYRDF